jgi:hypothetical protein
MSDPETNISFTVRLTQKDWDTDRHAWRCPSLEIPSAEIDEIFVGGNPVIKENYRKLEGPAAVRWNPPNPPDEAAAQIRLVKSLSLQSETDRWKKLAIVIPALASIVVALIAATATYVAKPDKPAFNDADHFTARLAESDVNSTGKFISYKIAVDPLDLSYFINNSEAGNYKLVVGVRPRSAAPHLEGQYDYAFGAYPFNNTATIVPPIDDKLKETAATGCIEFILFRINQAGLARLPFKVPFVPVNYGSDLKILQSYFNGECR